MIAGAAQSGRADRDSWRERARALFAEAFHASRDGIVQAQVRAPVVPVEAALRVLRMVSPAAQFEASWAPPAGPALAAVGEAARISLDGTRDFAALEREAVAASARIREITLDEAPGPSARWLGGVAFAEGSAASDPWRSFGEGSFTLPRLRYTRDGASAWLAVVTDRAGAAAALDELERVQATLASAEHAESESRPAEHLRVEQLGLARWTTLLDEILDGIRAGRFLKVVAARRAEVFAEGPIDVIDVLSRLRASAVGCTRFSLRAGDATFLGATPERLVARRGPQVLTEALAGSIDAASAAGHAALLASDKDLVEHALVVEEITRRLQPLSSALDVPPSPGVRQLRHVLHLHTPIEARLREPTHVLSLVAALHPTPAVGGLPVAGALEWIARREQAARGWYAGPVGWFDAHGDGEFAVALRSAVVRGNRAWLWAGAGIVAGSDPATEYEETGLKQRAMLGALGGAG